MKRVLLSLFVLLSINLSAATLTATQSGNWSDASTWGGTAPTGSADVVTIGAGFTVTLTGATAASSLVLNGTLNDAGFVLTLSKTNSTVLSSTTGGTHSGSGSITLTGNKLIKITASTGYTLTIGNLVVNQSAAASGYNNICEIGGGTVSITGTLTLNSGGVFALNTKTLILSNPVSSAGFFTGSDIYPGTGASPITSVNGGTLVPATGSITLNSSAAAIPNPTQLTTLMNLTINIGSGNTYTLTNPLTIAPNGTSAGNIVVTTGTLNTGANALTVNTGGIGVSSIAPGASLVVASGGSVNFNGQPLTIQSDATGSGSIQTVAGTLSGISNVTVQRYIANNTHWRMIGFPLSSSTTISASALATLYGAAYNAYTYTESADDGSNYNGANGGAANAGWTSFTSSATTTADKGILMIGGTPTSTLSATGTLNTGTQTITLSSTSGKGWNLVANPFASNITWSTVRSASTNVDATVYRYDPNTSAYASYNATSTSQTGNQSNVIENGAGFFVHVASPGSAASLSVTEAAKTSSAPAASLMGVQTSSNKSIIKLSLSKQGDQYSDEVVLRWGGGFAATDNFDGNFDAYDLGRATGPDLSVIGNDKTQYSIFHGSELKNSSDESRTVQLGIKNMTEGTYQIGIQLQSPIANGNKAYLYDSYTGTYTLIDDNTSNYSFITTADPKSQSSTRFSVVMNAKQVASIINDNSTLPVILLNNPSTGNNFTLYSKNNYNQLQWQVIDGGGRVMQTGQINSVLKGSTHQINAGNTATGHYFIKLSGDGNALPVLKAVKN